MNLRLSFDAGYFWSWKMVGRQTLWSTAGLCLLVSCVNRGKVVDRELRAAETARRAGDRQEEQDRFDSALSSAKSDDDRVEVLYRRAQSKLRQGQVDKALVDLQELAKNYPQSSRAARALFDSGVILEKAERLQEAEAQYFKVLTLYAASGLAGSAARRVVELRSARGILPTETYQELIEKNEAPELDEELRYRLGVAFEQDDKEKAIAAFEELARRHPLPSAVHTDEALLHAAKLRRLLGDPEGALKELEHLHRFSTRPAIVGSYTRPAYVEALFLSALILRDDQGQLEAAHRTFLTLKKRHPTSRLVDDALFEAAKTSSLLRKDPCQDLSDLRSLAPDSKYNDCAVYLCPAQGEEPESSSKKSRCQLWLSAPVSP